jgi:hypothetical protein
MSVLVEGWIPVGVFADINLKMVYTSATAVRLMPVDQSGPAYVPVFKANGEARMALIGVNGFPIVTTTGGIIGGLDVAVPEEDTGYDVYVLVKDDLSATAGIACIHGNVLVKPAGWGAVYASRAIRYFCCNVIDGLGVYTGIVPFVETRTRETFYCGEQTNVQIAKDDANPAVHPITLATSAGDRAGQFPATARKVFVEITATDDDDAGSGTLNVFFDGGTTPIYSLADIGGVNGAVYLKETSIEVPCSGNMDTAALCVSWTSGHSPLVNVYALGYQL